MDTTATHSSDVCLAPRPLRGKERRRIAYRARTVVKSASPLPVMNTNRFKKADFKRMQTACKLRPPAPREHRMLWVVSMALHTLLIVMLGAVMLAESRGERVEQVTIANVTFHETLPTSPVTRPAELILEDSSASAIPDEAIPEPNEEKVEEQPAPAQLADASVSDAVASAEIALAPSADGIRAEGGDWSQVKPRRTMGVSGNTSTSGSAVASYSSAPSNAGPAVGSAGGNSNSAGEITRSAIAQSLGGGEYPKRARKEQREGVVVLRVEVLESGRTGQIALHESSGHADLDETALAAAKHWRFKPALRGDVPTSMEVIVPVRYTLQD